MEIKIYTLSSTRDINNIRYVGKTKQTLKRRLSQHIIDARRCYKNGYFKNYNYNWIMQEVNSGYNIIISEIDCIEINQSEDWTWLEKYWISQIKTWGFRICNLTDGGDGNQNQVFSRESIEKRASKIRGIPRDEDTRKKISASLTGIKKSEETKKKVSNSIKELQGRKIKQFTKDGKFIKDWDCIKDAARDLNIDAANIGHCCKHEKNHNTAGGFIWRYKNDPTPVIPYFPNSVCQLDLNGNLINIFETATIASKQTNISITSISHCCNNKIKSVKGFVFKKYKDFMNT